MLSNTQVMYIIVAVIVAFLVYLFFSFRNHLKGYESKIVYPDDAEYYPIVATDITYGDGVSVGILSDGIANYKFENNCLSLLWHFDGMVAFYINGKESETIDSEPGPVRKTYEDVSEFRVATTQSKPRTPETEGVPDGWVPKHTFKLKFNNEDREVKFEVISYDKVIEKDGFFSIAVHWHGFMRIDDSNKECIEVIDTNETSVVYGFNNVTVIRE